MTYYGRRPPPVRNADGLLPEEVARGDRIHRAIRHIDRLSQPNRLWLDVIKTISRRDNLGLSKSEMEVVRLLRSIRDPWNPDHPPEAHHPEHAPHCSRPRLNWRTASPAASVGECPTCGALKLIPIPKDTP